MFLPLTHPPTVWRCFLFPHFQLYIQSVASRCLFITGNQRPLSMARRWRIWSSASEKKKKQKRGVRTKQSRTHGMMAGNALSKAHTIHITKPLAREYYLRVYNVFKMEKRSRVHTTTWEGLNIKGSKSWKLLQHIGWSHHINGAFFYFFHFSGRGVEEERHCQQIEITINLSSPHLGGLFEYHISKITGLFPERIRSLLIN